MNRHEEIKASYRALGGVLLALGFTLMIALDVALG